MEEDASRVEVALVMEWDEVGIAKLVSKCFVCREVKAEHQRAPRLF